ncbi:hypothetical protein TRIATDRAFT_300273 [Trichoderma atroviride IMI 206040]|uniref:Uncharacterized protein n=1 Tax=Hypocrea atroviridis (strain ATCC 20476 / IMI 206040) TaxID=452589 RepID=G9NZH8_HYPAI|nr:uncharacterized protein TRIATDRAFT_300273 [Trichoderma atroviride IMI 206040]EHK43883.1 hypothetical protein TRIATDRAFT_300273 [Trichoderma atroviride IMI 206040]
MISLWGNCPRSASTLYLDGTKSEDVFVAPHPHSRMRGIPKRLNLLVQIGFHHTKETLGSRYSTKRCIKYAR